MKQTQIVRIKYSLLFSVGGILLAGILLVTLRTVTLSTEQSVHSAACLTRQQVSSDSRCLYIMNNNVYQKGSRSSPHKGHPCGTDVTSIIPSFHTDTPSRYLTPNLVGPICTQPTPTAVQQVVLTATPLPPTAALIATPFPTAGPTATGFPTPTVRPSITPFPTPTRLPSPTVTAFPTATPAPTVPPLPTATPIPGAATLVFSVSMHGIGASGDNANPAAVGNNSPQHPQRTLHVQVLNTQAQVLFAGDTTVSYFAGESVFTGSLSLPITIQSGSYIIKVSSPLYLTKRIPGAQTNSQGNSIQLPKVTLIAGDTVADNQLSILDYNLIFACFSDVNAARACDNTKLAATDLNDDGKVNQYDYNLFLREFRFVQHGD